ncbi:MAG: VOC family protein [Deltaproteobacteria bacterium]|nr:VOC family protein [Deltaproteobacteria bacterium]
MAIVRHALTILAVEDLQASLAFYAQAFQWELAVQTPVYVEFNLPGGQRIGLYHRQAFARNTGKVPARISAGDIAPTEL